MQTTEELKNPSLDATDVSMEILSPDDIKTTLRQRHPNHVQLIEQLSDAQVTSYKALFLNTDIDAYLPFPRLIHCRERTLWLLDTRSSDFLKLAANQLPIEQFLQASDQIQQTCLEDTDSCLTLFDSINHNWTELLSLSEAVLSAILTNIHLSYAGPLDQFHANAMARALVHYLKYKPAEKTQLLFRQGPTIMAFCEANQLNLNELMQLPNLFIEFILENKDHWKPTVQHIPFSSWPIDIPVTHKVLNNLAYLFSPDCALLKTNQELIPLVQLLNAQGPQIEMIMQNLAKVLVNLKKYDWTLQDLLTLEPPKINMFLAYQAPILPCIRADSPIYQFLRDVLKPNMFQSISGYLLSKILENPESAYELLTNYQAPRPDGSTAPLFNLIDLHETMVALHQLPVFYKEKLSLLNIELQTIKSAIAPNAEKISQLEKDIEHIANKIQLVQGYPSLSNLLFDQASTLMSLHFINVHIKELLSDYPLLALDFIKHAESLLRYSNPKINIDFKILASFSEEKRQLFLQHSEQIAELMVEKHCNRDVLLAASPAEICARIRAAI